MWKFNWKTVEYMCVFQMKAMDANRYATKKTIAQGMLDIALLTANASQLKYILQVGEQHQFYKLMLILISLSIVLQVNSVNIVINWIYIGMELSYLDTGGHLKSVSQFNAGLPNAPARVPSVGQCDQSCAHGFRVLYNNDKSVYIRIW